MIILYILTLGYLHRIVGSQQCDITKDTPILDECLRPLNKSWEDTKKLKPQLDLLTFPLLNVEPQELQSLCTRYKEAKNKCGQQMESCKGVGFAKLVDKLFGYACKNNSDYSKDADCIWSTVNSNQQCVLLLRKNDEQLGECIQITAFYKCIEQAVQLKCKTKGVAALLHIIDHYGCDLVASEEKGPQVDRSCEPDDDQAVTTCFQPLTSLWTQLKQEDPVLENISLPLFYFKSVDVVRMCDLIEVIKDECPPIRQCPSHPLPQFANALLGLACGTQQNVFFSSFECIRSTLKQNDQCSQLIPGVWIPGKHRDACWRVPQFFNCIKDQMIFRCAPQGLAVLAQGLKQYGCNVDSGDIVGNWAVLPPGSKPDPKKNLTALVGSQTAPPGVPTVAVLGATVAPLGAPVGPLGGATGSSLSAPIDPPLGPPAAAAPPAAAPAPNSLPQLSAQSLLNEGNSAFPNPIPFKPINEDKLPVVVSPAAEKLSIGSSPSASLFQTGGDRDVLPLAPLASQSDVCDSSKRNQVRRCLQPLFARWVQIQTARQLNNLTFPMYHYDRVELLELCDHYASAFLICPFSVFQECLRDEVVFLANSVLGYLCSPQNVVSFMKHYDCISQAIRGRPFCEKFISGPLLLGVDIGTRCRGVQEFLSCNQLAVDKNCGQDAVSQFQESVRQFGCGSE